VTGASARRGRRITSCVTVLAMSFLLTACGTSSLRSSSTSVGSSSFETSPGTTPTDSSTGPTGSADQNTSSNPTSSALPVAMTANVSDSGGNAGVLTVSVGAPASASATSNAAIQSCLSVAPGDDPSASVVVPATFAVQLTSDQATDVTLDLPQVEFVQPDGGGDTGESIGNAGGAWALVSGGQAQCGGGTTIDLGQLNSGQTATFEAWMVFTNVVSPNDSSGSQVTDAALIADSVVFGGSGSTAEFKIVSPSPGVVTCDVGSIDGSDEWVALDPGFAVKSGCERGAHD
jgi:hypothetical protein